MNSFKFAETNVNDLLTDENVYEYIICPNNEKKQIKKKNQTYVYIQIFNFLCVQIGKAKKKMSSSLMLDNFVIQEQHQPTQNNASTYHFYKEHEQEYFEQTSNYLPQPSPPPPPSSSQPLIVNVTPTSQTRLKKCTCCPYGFHIDLDFIRYCEELAANGKSPSRKQLDRRNKRRQRKSLEVMLGFDDQWVLDLEKEILPPKQQKSEFETVYEVRNPHLDWCLYLK